ncbi:putative uncharacterized protein DDB_G0293878 [Adelges cooleyi]|uniref:putative uncharacterized protein DDB_G0293878 n=1 Tax=Adelges cooleyi TaxID=133065 RepID=UPI00217FEF69|nr:putative uncharacterized protein DDB_G0293878 [Adelges cooleyi]
MSSTTMFIDGGNAEAGDDPSDGVCVELLGEPLAKHGSCTFYKAMRYKTTKTKEDAESNGDSSSSPWNTVLLNRFYAVRPWSDSDTICIGELELLWQDDAAKDGDEYGDDSSSSSNEGGTNKRGCSTSASVNGRLPSNYHAEQLASLRLYIVPDQTPMGRNSTHGEDEVLEITDRIVLRAKDMVAWIRGATNNDIGESSAPMTNAYNIPSNGCRSVKQEDLDDNVKKEAAFPSEVDDECKQATTMIKTETDVETDRRESNEGISPDNQQIIPLLACAINYTDVLNYDAPIGNSNNKQQNDSSSTTQASNNDLSVANCSTSEDLVVMSYSRYCRYRAMLKRLEEILVPDENAKETDNTSGNTVFSSLKNRLIVNSLGGDDFYVDDGASDDKQEEHRGNKCIPVDRNIKRVLFCRDTFDYPELETHEMLCNHLAPKLKGPSFRWNRVKAMAASSAAAAAAAAAAQLSSDDSDDDDESHVEGSESSTGSESRFSGVKRGRPSGSSNGANGSTTVQTKKTNTAAQLAAAASSHAKNLQYIEQKLNGVAAIPVPKPAPSSSKRRKLQHPQQIIQQQYQHQYQIQSQLIQQQYQQRFLQQHGHQQQKSHHYSSSSTIAEHMSSASREQLDLVDALRQGGLEVTPIVVHNNPEAGGRSSNSGVRRRYSNSSSNCTFDGEDNDNEDDEVNIITVTPDVVCILNKPDSGNSPVNFSTTSGGNNNTVTGPMKKKNPAANVECPTLPSETSITPSSNVGGGGGDNRTMQLHRKINQAIDSLKEQIQENNNGSVSNTAYGRNRPLPQRLSNGGNCAMSDSNAATNWLLNNDNITVAVLNSSAAPSSSNRARGASPSGGRSYQSQVLDLTSNHRRNSGSSATSHHHNSAAVSSSGPIDLAMNKPNRAPSIQQQHHQSHNQQQQQQQHHHHNVGSNLEITIVPSVTTSHHLLNHGATTTASSRQQIYTNPTAAKPSLTVRQQLQQRSAGAVAAQPANSGGGNNRERSRTKQQAAAAASRQNQNMSNISASTTAAMLQQEYLNNLYGQMLQQRQSFEALAAAFNTPHQQQQLFLLAAAAQQARQQAQSQQNKNNNNRGVNKD